MALSIFNYSLDAVVRLHNARRLITRRDPHMGGKPGANQIARNTRREPGV